ncbi:hypothetical protein SDC9_169404 [bioreactor metagenome]|uniref:Uncharacterized protein n=1 Tax=bioreactor metagenome TaxID=1076179 RepID=A0A645G581_9ZZZZ
MKKNQFYHDLRLDNENKEVTLMTGTKGLHND